MIIIGLKRINAARKKNWLVTGLTHWIDRHHNEQVLLWHEHTIVRSFCFSFPLCCDPKKINNMHFRWFLVGRARLYFSTLTRVIPSIQPGSISLSLYVTWDERWTKRCFINDSVVVAWSYYLFLLNIDFICGHNIPNWWEILIPAKCCSI